MFMQDETQIIERQPKAVTETQTTTTSKTVGQKPSPPDESMLAGASGRFWIVMMLVAGLVALVIINSLTGRTPEANLLAGYIGVATMAIGVYMGQKAKSNGG